MTASPPPAVDKLVDHLFRRESGRLVARLVRVLGPQRLDLAEEAVQDAMIQALRSWPFTGSPSDPAAWLTRVAHNRALDVLRREGVFAAKHGEVRSLDEARLDRIEEPAFAGEIEDDRLRLMFVCCHPALPGDGRIALTLKVVCGFSVREIARAFLAADATVAQRIARAKRLIRERAIPYGVPGPNELPERRASVLKVLYLMFNEGYSPGEGEAVIRADICSEAVRLAEAAAAHPVTGTAESHALAALLLLQGARLEARQDSAGDILLLDEQDRSIWNAQWLERGFRHLELSMSGDRLTAYHLEAGIAACHAAAPSLEATDWPAIVGYYDRLLELCPSAVTELNRAVALAMIEGPAAGLAAIDGIAGDGSLRDYPLLHSVRGELCRRAGRRAEARSHLQCALDQARSLPVRRLLERRLAAL
ncbi:MAG TPA: sigma-70 family RNA polymerase sigma factor [Thermoanaerobaculia bacterium]|nr:sigma-70 family RNA polymerase sigma factor [Thermoanaerobaculia bacterium]